MKGSEYLAARTAIGAIGLVIGCAIVAATALWLVPLLMKGLERIAPNLLPPFGGTLVGLAVVVGVALLMKSLLGRYLDKFELWVIEQGGIDD